MTGGISLFLKLAIGFGIEAGVVVFVTTCLGAIVINLSRNIIVTSVVGVIYGFVSCLFIGSERGFVIPGMRGLLPRLAERRFDHGLRSEFQI